MFVPAKDDADIMPGNIVFGIPVVNHFYTGSRHFCCSILFHSIGPQHAWLYPGQLSVPIKISNPCLFTCQNIPAIAEKLFWVFYKEKLYRKNQEEKTAGKKIDQSFHSAIGGT